MLVINSDCFILKGVRGTKKMKREQDKKIQKGKNGNPDRISVAYRLNAASALKLETIATAMGRSKTKTFEIMIDAVSAMQLKSVDRLPAEMKVLEHVNGTFKAMEELHEKINFKG